MIEQQIACKAKPRYLCRWWLKTRVSKKAIPYNKHLYVWCHEFYVPWYAWPLELIHRLVFGRVILNVINE